MCGVLCVIFANFLFSLSPASLSPFLSVQKWLIVRRMINAEQQETKLSALAVILFCAMHMSYQPACQTLLFPDDLVTITFNYLTCFFLGSCQRGRVCREYDKRGVSCGIQTISTQVVIGWAGE
jgi:hypothetical protein